MICGFADIYSVRVPVDLTGPNQVSRAASLASSWVPQHYCKLHTEEITACIQLVQPSVSFIVVFPYKYAPKASFWVSKAVLVEESAGKVFLYGLKYLELKKG